ncbi:MAG TPA: hypothetical protein VFB72_03210 [Verrucomicrobiae bacterium]|nr:hypothetical protein [Verrucomicrobiae bacterium]
MKFINARAGLVILVFFTTLKSWAIPQSPEAWGLEAEQNTLFNGGKYYLVLAQPIGNNHFQAIGIDTQFSASGTYQLGGMGGPDFRPEKNIGYMPQISYITFPFTNGTLVFSGGDIGGQFKSSGPVDSPANGNMLRATGTAPITPNVSYNLTVTDGNAPFASQGSLTFTPAADGTYTIKSASSNTVSSSGTYSYAVTNAVAGCFNITDSINGESTTYFCYYTPTNGFFMLTQPGGGYQVGTFVASSQVLLPAFFNGSTNVTSEVSFLRFTNGTPFGFYDVADFTFPLFYHNDMGFEWFFDANNDAHGAYLYDFSSSTFFYTDPTLFPYLYDFTLNSWLYYCPDTKHAGHYTSNPRWFYQFSNQQFITK